MRTVFYDNCTIILIIIKIICSFCRLYSFGKTYVFWKKCWNNSYKKWININSTRIYLCNIVKYGFTWQRRCNGDSYWFFVEAYVYLYIIILFKWFSLINIMVHTPPLIDYSTKTNRHEVVTLIRNALL